MPSAYWGAGQAPSLFLPETWLEWTLLCGYLLLFVFLLFRDRSNLQLFSLRKWIGWLTLGVLALVASQLFPISFNPILFPFAPESGDSVSISLLAAVPSLLAGVILGPGPALLVGMSAGLGRALGQSHQIFDLFHYAFAAWLAASLLRNRYHGRLYGALRNPAVSGSLSQSAIALMAGFAAFFLSADAGLFSRLDLALAEMLGSVFPLFIEGLSGGLVVVLILLVMPAWRTGKDLIPPPGQRSVQHYLLSNLLLFGATVVLLVAAATLFVTTSVATKMAVAELAAEANASTAHMADFHAQMENSLLDFGSEDDLLDGTKVNGRALSRLYRTAGHYDQVLVIDGEHNVAASYPLAKSTDGLTGLELSAVSEALQDDGRSLIVDSAGEEDPRVSLVVPLTGVPAGEKSALIGRVKKNSLAKTLDGLAGNNYDVSGAIVNLDGAPVVEVGDDDRPWMDAFHSRVEPIVVADDYGGRALLGESESGARQLIYLAPADNRNWLVVASVPYKMVLKQALGAAIPLMLALVAVAGVFSARLAGYSRSLSGSIVDLTKASRNIANGVPVTPQTEIVRQDEVGELSRALADMQRGQKKRMDELSLLLSVSRESSTSFELSDSLPVVLHGALRGTGASGVHGLVLNPTGGRPISFAEGPTAQSMRVFDDQFMSMMRHNDELALGSPQAIQDELEIAQSSELSVKALFVLPLQVEGKFLGFLAVGFRDQRVFSQEDIALLQSLARQASVLVQKSYLYTYAESGRRRLAAVLASTSEAVIVIDQTSRILTINRAMEHAFDISAQQVTGRAVSDVIDSPLLVNALTSGKNGIRDLEIAGKDGRIYFANTSKIINHERQALGHVAVLHDATHLKEIDRLKSDFVDNVSHDLRTPLTILSGYASALSLLDDLTPLQREYADHILLSVERMNRLVEDLLDLGRIDSGVALVFEEVDIKSLLQDIADEHWLFAHEAGIRIHVRAADDLPAVRCDKALVRQAIANLLMNGFKYAPDSGQMTLAAERSENEIWISVRDRGPGISEDDQKRLFEKFYRAKRHGAGPAKGSGLGLAIVKTIAERHGGQAWCESTPGKGSEFYISLPAEN